jgi:hypothetical protein
MVHIELTIQRRHLFVVAALIVAVLVVWPSMSRASHTFDDVGDSNVFHSDIDWLAANGVTKGCNPPHNTKFCPSNPVTREQMAAFMKRLATGGAVDAGSLGGVDAETLMARMAALEAENDALQATLAGVTRNGDTLVFDGMNLQIVNGQGSTSTQNSLGNLIIGYNEDGTVDTGVALRTGSHYLIVGKDNEWTRHGGIVSGLSNSSTGSYASVTGGWKGQATVAYASVTGGHSNVASGNYASVTGGRNNQASGGDSSITGGRDNRASAGYSSVTGGNGNQAQGSYSSLTGGNSGNAIGDYSSVTGGSIGIASGNYSSVTGGSIGWAFFDYSSVSGGFDLETTSTYQVLP